MQILRSKKKDKMPYMTVSYELMLKKKRCAITIMNDTITRTPVKFWNTKFLILLFNTKWTQK